RYYTPSGRTIQEQGIVPDILLKSPDDDENEDSAVHESMEAVLQSLSEDEGEIPAKTREPATVILLPKRAEGDTTDLELDEALRHLKTLAGPSVAAN
ncbi:MAG: hypothetical protein OXC42_07525, partial [Gammaproteobacteria bacterium]|nr:hypothetical protein [Gammaproteobacteria bacterium]